jgi:hypothetical protein
MSQAQGLPRQDGDHHYEAVHRDEREWETL